MAMGSRCLSIGARNGDDSSHVRVCCKCTLPVKPSAVTSNSGPSMMVVQ